VANDREWEGKDPQLSPREVKPVSSRRWQPPCWAAVYLFVSGVIQFYFVSVPYDADTTYHIAVGRLIQAHGILHAFPWTPFSWLADHYADKELLLHLLFVPFARVDWITASKIVGTLLGAVLLLALYLILRKEKVHLAGIWALLPLIASDVFLFRFSLVRPHLISIALALLLLWAAARGRLFLLALLSALYPWSYVAFWQIPLMLLVAVEAGHTLSGEGIRWKPAAAVAGGVFLGWLLHPNSMNLLALNWIHMIDVLLKNAWQSVAGIELGQEFLPFALSQWAEWLLGCLLMAIAGLVLAWRNRKRDSLALAFAFATIAFGILTARTARFAEYFIPFSVVTFALATRWIPWKTIPILALCVLLPYTGFPLAETLDGIGTRIDRIPPSFITWLRQEIPEGTQVFTTEWGHTGTLMLALPERKFIVALDPTLFRVKAPELYRLWYDLPRDPKPGMAEKIRRKFSARYVISFREVRFSEFYALLAMEPGVRILHASNMWMIYDLGGP
jgi:hypothetical protein